MKIKGVNFRLLINFFFPLENTVEAVALGGQSVVKAAEVFQVSIARHDRAVEVPEFGHST
jgi:hypothetical protein